MAKRNNSEAARAERRRRQVADAVRRYRERRSEELRTRYATEPVTT
jgi:hypothetical protein